MPLKAKSITPDVETQIGIIFKILQDWDIAEASRREREKDNEELLHDLKSSVKGNGKPGLEKEMVTVQLRLTAVMWGIGVICGGVLADLLSHYSGYIFK